MGRLRIDNHHLKAFRPAERNGQVKMVNARGFQANLSFTFQFRQVVDDRLMSCCCVLKALGWASLAVDAHDNDEFFLTDINTHMIHFYLPKVVCYDDCWFPNPGTSSTVLVNADSESLALQV
jgi:hypothetical protein